MGAFRTFQACSINFTFNSPESEKTSMTENRIGILPVPPSKPFPKSTRKTRQMRVLSLPTHLALCYCPEKLPPCIIPSPLLLLLRRLTLNYRWWSVSPTLIPGRTARKSLALVVVSVVSHHHPFLLLLLLLLLLLPLEFVLLLRVQPSLMMDHVKVLFRAT